MIECVTLTNAQSTNNVGRLGSGCGAVGRAVACDTRGSEWSIKNNVGRHIDFTQDRHG